MVTRWHIYNGLLHWNQQFSFHVIYQFLTKLFMKHLEKNRRKFAKCYWNMQNCGIILVTFHSGFNQEQNLTSLLASEPGSNSQAKTVSLLGYNSQWYFRTLLNNILWYLDIWFLQSCTRYETTLLHVSLQSESQKPIIWLAII